MSEEEKKAIEFFEKSFKKKIPPYWYDNTISNIEEKIKIILNLIEKQQKEIEKNKELEMQLLEKDLYIDGLKEDRRIAIEEIQEEYYSSKDKIKEKIEEYEDILQSSIIKEDYKKEVEHIIEVLKELRGEN